MISGEGENAVMGGVNTAGGLLLAVIENMPLIIQDGTVPSTG